MELPWLTTVSGIVGSMVGVSATIAVAWVNQRTNNQRELLREDIRTREKLYGDFVGECAHLLVDAFQHTLEKPETVLPAYALLNRIRLCASHQVLTAAELLLVRITEQYFAGNQSMQELRELTHSTQADPLKEFGEACRLEFKALRRQL